MKRNSLYILFFLLLITVSSESLIAQLSGNSTTEYQLGNIPDAEPADLSTLYNQLNLQYRQKKIKTSLRLEQFYDTDSVNRDYQKITQWLVQYKHKKIELKAGHFYETLGRGLLYRSFEIPSSIREDRIYRVRNGFYRDMRGVSFNYKGKNFKLKAIYGNPLQLDFPPGHENRYTETIEAIQPEFTFAKQNIGMIAMRYSHEGNRIVYSSLFGQGNLPWNFSYYGEYGRNMTENPNAFQFKEDDGFAAYFSLNHSYKNYGSSLELKKYQNFQVGSGLTDPPTLVKEHSYRLLNRSTHVPELMNESGYQLEVYYSFEDGKMLTANLARAVNHFTDDFIFEEYFLEMYWPFISGSYAKLFLDYSKSELKLETERYAGGVYFTKLIKGEWSATLESELQLINREYNTPNPIYNTYLGLSLNKSTSLSVSLFYEFTSDKVVADLGSTNERESTRHFYGAGLTYRPNHKNTFSLFVGERQGGPACTSGICYDVLDFSGAEIRWTIKF